MGNLFSKKKTQVAPERPLNSAPARLEGLDGTTAGPRDSRPNSAPTDNLTVLNGAALKAAVHAAHANAELATTPTKRKVDVLGVQSDGTALSQALPTATTIPEDRLHWTKALPEHVVRSLHSSDWKDREQGLTGTGRAVVAAAGTAKAGPAFSVACEVLVFMLRDKVAPLYHASLDVLQQLVATYGTTSSLSAEAVRSGMDALLPQLIHRCGNSNTRIHEASLQALLGMANCPALGVGFLAPHVLALPASNAAQAAQLAGRLGLVAELLGLQQQGMGASRKGGAPQEGRLDDVGVMELCKAGLAQADEKARQAAVRTLCVVHTQRKAAGRAGLDPDTCMGPIKPALAQLLARRFGEADGSGGAEDSGLSVSGTSAARAFGKQLPPLVAAVQAKAAAVGGGLHPAPPSGHSPTRGPRSRMGPPAAGFGGMAAPSPRLGTPMLGGVAGGAAGSPTMRSKPVGSGAGMPRILDDQEETLINYIITKNELEVK